MCGPTSPPPQHSPSRLATAAVCIAECEHGLGVKLGSPRHVWDRQAGQLDAAIGLGGTGLLLVHPHDVLADQPLDEGCRRDVAGGRVMLGLVEGQVRELHRHWLTPPLAGAPRQLAASTHQERLQAW